MTCEACKTIPQVVVDNYQIKGEYKDIGGLKTYITGPRTSTSALLTIYDIFGLAPQTLQGADLLSQALNCLVFVPDFLKGRYAQEEFFGKISDPEVEKRKGEFWAILGFEENLALLGRWMEGVKGREGFEDVRDWGALGLCWGGKVVALASGPGTNFKVSGQTHPGRLAVEDAKRIAIPHIVLASNGEDERVVAEYKEALEGEGKVGVVETYANMHHGWMGARAKLHEAENLKEFERGYNQIATYFSKYL